MSDKLQDTYNKRGQGSQDRTDKRFRNNTGGLSAFQREQRLVSHYGPKDDVTPSGRSEWDVLRENHRFIRDDEEPTDVPWEERLARAYESKLFKEFALIDLKHYKSKRLALRWRTAPEVVDGIGEDTCGSLRCKYHLPITQSTTSKRRELPRLKTFELPFVYEEAGERKEALVKVRLCPKCETKLVWKPGKDDVSGSEEELQKKERHQLREKTEKRRSRSRSPERRRKRQDDDE
ncbi:hypothetical protein TREMEDRAFT_26773 [Tremella mesenterica DSM 1558]|uniref:uncharacterized protein n=1 Tax=Tremella mesenterica (strain ATCC 24925 / CBS 8224 / DSM 1558 / NBRC 9311 / NRRL Y-6157 / RJB 2259-6 / UBC 559-6) TaxID=578456 RepID=UPI0003F493F5|nr:uncharacterized protein TREMEDRAFT_26773 [Tremella mesenterica DSM 1558]EIW72699.1 hypothetical protein TREMEDRAFT_26773 [Tremella mesenterica DSM 1558]